jgi:hypothetical protein
VVLIPAGLLDADPGARPTRHIFVGVKAKPACAGAMRSRAAYLLFSLRCVRSSYGVGSFGRALRGTVASPNG